MKEPRWRWKG